MSLSQNVNTPKPFLQDVVRSCRINFDIHQLPSWTGFCSIKRQKLMKRCSQLCTSPELLQKQEAVKGKASELQWRWWTRWGWTQRGKSCWKMQSQSLPVPDPWQALPPRGSSLLCISLQAGLNSAFPFPFSYHTHLARSTSVHGWRFASGVLGPL